MGNTLKKILFTGASSGVGLAHVKLLGPEYGEFWFCGRDLETLNRVFGAWPHVHFYHLDLENQESVAQTILALQLVGGFDEIYHYAGAGLVGWPDLETRRRYHHLNVIGPQVLLDTLLTANPECKVVIVASMAALFPWFWGGRHYVEAKREIAEWAISNRYAAVYLGFVDTAFFRHCWNMPEWIKDVELLWSMTSQDAAQEIDRQARHGEKEIIVGKDAEWVAGHWYAPGLVGLGSALFALSLFIPNWLGFPLGRFLKRARKH